MEKNKVFILREKLHTSCSIYRFSNETQFPISQNAKVFFSELETLSDVVLIFPEKLKDRVKIEKFCSLHRIFAYSIEPNKKSVPESVLETVNYMFSVMEGYQNYFYINTYVTGYELDAMEEYIEGMKKVTSHVDILSASIFRIGENREAKLSEIYMKEKKKFNPIRFLMEKTFEDRYDMYYTMECVSQVISLRPMFLRTLTDFLGNHKKYLETFARHEEFGGFLASVTSDLGTLDKKVWLDEDILTLNLENNDNNTKRKKSKVSSED